MKSRFIRAGLAELALDAIRFANVDHKNAAQQDMSRLNSASMNSATPNDWLKAGEFFEHRGHRIFWRASERGIACISRAEISST